MLITVAICTLNRAESLRRTLQSLAMMRVPDGLSWEIVVVNNNCTDHTDIVIEAFANKLPIRRESESRRGLSHARNRAINASKGDYIVWTDDDVIVDPLWIASYAEAFRREPTAAVFGGRIKPLYETPLVKWVAESEGLLGGPYAIRDFGCEPGPICVGGGRTPYGANFAIRASEQRTFRYNPELGLGPEQGRVGEETDVIGKIMQSGATGRWVPAACVQHCISRERQTIRYISKCFANQGETEAFHNMTAFETSLWFGVPRWQWRQLIEEWLRYRVHRMISPAPVWLGHLRRYRRAYGAIRYRLNSSRMCSSR